MKVHLDVECGKEFKQQIPVDASGATGCVLSVPQAGLRIPCKVIKEGVTVELSADDTVMIQPRYGFTIHAAIGGRIHHLASGQLRRK